MPHPAIEAAEAYRTRLLAQEQDAATRLIEAYWRAFDALDAERQALEQFLAGAAVNLNSRADIERLAVVRSLMRQLMVEVDRYAEYADQQIADAIELSIALAVEGARATVLAYGVGNPVVTQALAAAWDSLSVEAIQTSIGFTAPGSPLYTRLSDTLGEAVATRVGTVLVEGISLGVNPRLVGQALQREFGLGLTWSLTTARTAQLWAYREATRQSYLANRDVVSGWKWWSALDSRCCMSCLSMHGRTFDVTETLNDHHNGRCSMVPVVPLALRLGIQPLPNTTGEQWFRTQSVAAQRKQMGPGLWEAWQNGAFSFSQLPVPYLDPIYGDMMRAATLEELTGDQAAIYTAQAKARRTE